MQRHRYYVAFLLLLAACSKTPDAVFAPPAEVKPAMFYKNYSDREASYLRTAVLDVDNDGAGDFIFGVQLVGDPVLKRDRWQFLANSGADKNLLNDAADQSPVLNKGDGISTNMSGYEWFEVSSILLAEKIVSENGSYWDGAWKDASHKFLPIQLRKDGRLFNGWVELSFDKAKQALVIHRSGISTEAEKSVKAGY